MPVTLQTTRNPIDVEVAIMELLGRILDPALRAEIARRCSAETERLIGKPKRRRGRARESAAWSASVCSSPEGNTGT